MERPCLAFCSISAAEGVTDQWKWEIQLILTLNTQSQLEANRQVGALLSLLCSLQNELFELPWIRCNPGVVYSTGKKWA